MKEEKRKLIICCVISFIFGFAPGYFMLTAKVESHNYTIAKQKKEIQSLENRITQYIDEIKELKK